MVAVAVTGHTGKGETVLPSFGSEEVSGILGLFEFVGWWNVIRFAMHIICFYDYCTLFYVGSNIP